MILVCMLTNQAHPWKDYHYAAIAFKVRAADLEPPHVKIQGLPVLQQRTPPATGARALHLYI